ncbi:MAG: hypothetical protein IPO09_06040 [Anaeromyxobacter sp.]|nr:hypothetical protein [Anaeromyxobacter sp.]
MRSVEDGSGKAAGSQVRQPSVTARPGGERGDVVADQVRARLVRDQERGGRATDARGGQGRELVEEHDGGLVIGGVPERVVGVEGGLGDDRLPGLHLDAAGVGRHVGIGVDAVAVGGGGVVADLELDGGRQGGEVEGAVALAVGRVGGEGGGAGDEDGPAVGDHLLVEGQLGGGQVDVVCAGRGLDRLEAEGVARGRVEGVVAVGGLGGEGGNGEGPLVGAALAVDAAGVGEVGGPGALGLRHHRPQLREVAGGQAALGVGIEPNVVEGHQDVAEADGPPVDDEGLAGDGRGEVVARRGERLTGRRDDEGATALVGERRLEGLEDAAAERRGGRPEGDRPRGLLAVIAAAGEREPGDERRDEEQLR